MGLRRSSLVVWAALLAVGLYAASPFLSEGLVGTGEAFNYSLSVGDALAQMHAGIVPPLAGQSEWAFNGRIHPLRNAPYLHYLAAAINEVTLHRLTFWQVQNASLVLSIVGAAVACYAGLRWSTGCRRGWALLLASLYVLCPPLLSSAHTLNLFMTVHAAVFVPLAVAACIRGCRMPSFHADALLAAAVAATWLAHPPVALWLTASVTAFRLAWFVARPRWRVLVNGLVAVLAGAALASFVFVSTGTMRRDLGLLSSDPSLWNTFGAVIFHNLQKGFPGCLLPVSRLGGELGDIQLGYAPYLLLVLCLVLLLRRRPAEPDAAPRQRRGGGTAVAVASLLLLLLLPVPGFTSFIWTHLPVTVYQLTTEWPIQRIYLIALAYLLFGAALLIPPAAPRIPPWVVGVASLVALTWTAYQAQAFIDRGYSNRLSEKDTLGSYRSSNLSLTITSYAFVGPPPTFVHGVMDPFYEFRLLKGGQTETDSQTAAAQATGKVVDRGMLRSDKGLAGADIISSPNIRLLPHRRYLITFGFLTPPLQGLLYFVGPLLNRTYILPQAGEALGFGMLKGQSRSIPVWTDSETPEDIQVHVWISDKTGIPVGATDLASYVLQEIDPARLPIQVAEPYPLRFSVDAPTVGYTVETPRRFIPGYTATVNGNEATPLLSTYGQVMVPLPAGHSTVELVYHGPRVARIAFWFCGAAWAVFLVWWISGRAARSDPYATLSAWARATGLRLRRHRGTVGLGALALVILLLAALGVRRWYWRRGQVGPVLIEFKFPYGQKGLNEPLLTTGHKGAGVVIFANMIDERHVRIEADVWGRLYQGEPVDLDFSQPHTLVVSDGALAPLGQPAVRALSASDRDNLRQELRIELDGTVVLHTAADTFDSAPAETVVGTAPFGSLTEPRFTGQILRTARLPLPSTLLLPKSQRAHVDLRLPRGRDGRTEPLLSILKGANTRLLTASYLSPTTTRFSCYDATGNVLQAIEVPVTAGTLYQLGADYEDASHGVALNVTLDGTPLFVLPDTSTLEEVPILTAGLNMTGNHAVEARFTGQTCQLRVEHPAEAKPAAGGVASADLVLTFPSERPGRQEPIVTTGKTGAGDLLYVIYVDAQHVKIGFDHWNGGGMVSGLIPLDYNNPHELLIRMDSLRGGAASGTNAEARFGKPGVSVLLDGVTAIDSPTAPYRSTAGEVTFGHNLIGGSTADRDFSGVIHFLANDFAAPENKAP